jgi:hypothetical protein
LAAAALAVVALGAGGCSSHPRNPYAGGHFTPQFPSFLPARSLHPADDRVLTGTTAKPALSVQGESVRVETPAWSVLVDVQGPVVPGEGLPVQTPATTCTWTVTMSQATATVPVSLVDFNSVDHLGHIYQLTAVEGQPAPPTAVAPGQTVRFQLRAYEAVGEGIMRWAPDRQHIVAMWDYEVEND